METDYTSDTDQLKLSLSPKFTIQRTDFSEMCFGEEATSPRCHRVVKPYRKIRPCSAPRIYVTDTSNWRDFSLPNYCIPDLRRTSAVYIEQDIINKQRQEIQLLMEELGNRDQELNDLVMSHQKQIAVWECDNEKQKSLQIKLSWCDDELKSKEDLVKKTLVEMAQVKEQQEVDAMELKRTQNEMIKLTERVMENSLYIQEMETENQKLNSSLRDFLNARQAFSAKEQELLVFIKEKELLLADKEQEVDKLHKHMKYLEGQCRELGERNNNMNEESVNWKKKCYQMKEEVERLADDCKTKEDNMHKMTQQLHESLQQAIALQKALFTSCEREKCKEEVMYSLRKQHKRTMQELQNMRELYDRLSRDTTVYHLSVKDKESAGDLRKKEDDSTEEEARGKRDGKHPEEADMWHQDGRRKCNTNMSFNKAKQSETREESFQGKETKDRQPETRDLRNMAVNGERSAESSIEKNVGKATDKSMSGKTDTPRSHGCEFASALQDTSDRLLHDVKSNVAMNGPSSSTSGNSGHTTIYRNASTAANGTVMFADDTAPPRCASSRRDLVNSSSTTEDSYDQPPARNMEHSDICRFANLSNSQFGSSAGKPAGSHTASPISIRLDHQEDARFSNASHTGSEDVDNSQTDTNRPVNPHQETNGLRCDSDTSTDAVNTKMTSSTRPGILSRSTEQQQRLSSDGQMTQAPKHYLQKKTAEFSSQVQFTQSCGRDALSQIQGPKYESHSTLSAEITHCSSARKSLSPCSIYCQPRQRSDYCNGGVSPQREEGRKKSSLDETDTPSDDRRLSSVHGGGSGWHFDIEVSQEHDNARRNCQTANFGRGYMNQKGEEQEVAVYCDQCTARGRQFCDCSSAKKVFAASSTPDTFDPGLSQSGVSYQFQNKSGPHAPKVSFMKEGSSHMEHGMSMKDPLMHHLQDLGKGKQVADTSLAHGHVSDIGNPTFRNCSTQVQFPSCESFHCQSNTSCQPRRTSCEDLPVEVSDYLARQHSDRRVMYNNNNNRSNGQLPGIETDNGNILLEKRCGVVEDVRGGDSQGTTCADVACGSSGRCHSNAAANTEELSPIQNAENIREVEQRHQRVHNGRRGKRFYDRKRRLNDGQRRLEDSMRSDLSLGTNLKDKEMSRFDVRGRDKTILHVKDTDKARLEARAKDNDRVDIKDKDKLRLDLNEKDKDIFDVNEKDKVIFEVNEKNKVRFDVKDKNNARFDVRHKDKIRFDVKDKDKARFDVRDRDNVRFDVKDKDKARFDVRYRDNVRFDVKDKDKARFDVRDKDKARFDVRDKDNARFDVRDKDNARFDVIDKDNARFDVKDKDKARFDVKDKDKARFDVRDKDNARFDVRDKDNARFDVKDKDNARFDVKDKDKARFDVKDKDNARFDVRDKDKARFDVKDKDKARFDVKDKDNARFDVRDKDKARFDVKDKDNARFDVKDKDNARFDVRDKDNARFDVRDKDNARFDVKDKDKARFDVKDKDNARFDVKDKDNARFDVKDKDNARFDVKDKDNARFDVRDKDNARFDVRDKDNARFDVRDKDNARFDVRDKDNARFDVRDKDNARFDVRDKDNARFDVRDKDNVRFDVKDKDNARFDVRDKDNVTLDGINQKLSRVKTCVSADRWELTESHFEDGHTSRKNGTGVQGPENMSFFCPERSDSESEVGDKRAARPLSIQDKDAPGSMHRFPSLKDLSRVH